MLPSLLALSLLSPSGARADEVEAGLQAALFPAGLDFVESFLTDLDFTVEDPDLGGEVGCYDELAVEDLYLTVAIDSVSLDLRGSTLAVRVDFGQIYAEDFGVYGEDADTWDSCPEFEAEVEYVEVNDAVLELGLSVKAAGTGLELVIVEEPVLTGDLDTDVAWFPDDLVLSYFEDALFEAAGAKLGEVLPGLLGDFLQDAVSAYSFGEFTVDVRFDDVDVDPEALIIRASPDVDWTGIDGCPTDRISGTLGDSPTLRFEESTESDFAVGVTEGAVNELFLAAWRDGYFCFTEENISEFLDLIAGAFDPEVGGLEGTASLDAAPEVRIDPDGLRFSLRDIGARVTGEIDGEEDELLEIRGDIHGRLTVGLDQDISAFTVSLVELSLDVEHLDASHLASGEDGEAKLEGFLESWLAGWLTTLAQDMVLFSSRYHLWEVALKVDEMHAVEGGVEVYISLFHADDPEVDHTPPDTRFTLLDAGETWVELELSGTDDRVGPLAYSYRLDGAGWSDWSGDTTVLLTSIQPGYTRIEVVARDQWLNVDPTPADQWLELDEPGETTRSCACAAPGTSHGIRGLPWLGGLLVFGLVRRRGGA